MKVARAVFFTLAPGSSTNHFWMEEDIRSAADFLYRPHRDKSPSLYSCSKCFLNSSVSKVPSPAALTAAMIGLMASASPLPPFFLSLCWVAALRLLFTKVCMANGLSCPHSCMTLTVLPASRPCSAIRSASSMDRSSYVSALSGSLASTLVCSPHRAMAFSTLIPIMALSVESSSGDLVPCQKALVLMAAAA